MALEEVNRRSEEEASQQVAVVPRRLHWEKIDEQVSPVYNKIYVLTERARVEGTGGGGWLVRTWVHSKGQFHSVDVAFVPDGNEMWDFR